MRIKIFYCSIAIFFITAFFLKESRCYADYYSVDLENYKIINRDLSADFFLDFQNISFEVDSVYKTLETINPNFLKGINSELSTNNEKINLSPLLDVLDKGDLDQAEKLLPATDKRSKYYPYILSIRAWINFSKNNYKSAIEEFNELETEYEGNGSKLESSFLKAVSFFEQKNLQKAEEEFNKTISFFYKENELIKLELDQLNSEEPLFDARKLNEEYFLDTNKPDILRVIFINREIQSLLQKQRMVKTLKEQFLSKRTLFHKEILESVEQLIKDISKKRERLEQEKGEKNIIAQLDQHLIFLEKVHASKNRSREEAEKVIDEKIEEMQTVLLKSENSIGQVFRKELTLKFNEIINSTSFFHAWSEFYITRILYINYLSGKDGEKREELLKSAIDGHKIFLKKYDNWNYRLEDEVINRLIDLTYEQKGFSDEVIALYQKIIDSRFSSNTEIASALYELANAYYNEKKYSKAEEIFQQIKNKYPQSQFLPGTFFFLGEINLKSGESDKAVIYYELASSYVNSYYSFISLYRKGWILNKINKDNEAVGVYTELLKYISKYNNNLIAFQSAEERETINGLITGLKEEAVEAITTWLYDDAKGTDTLFSYFSKYKENPFLVNILASYGKILRVQQNYAEEIEIYKKFLNQFPHRHEMVEVFSRFLTDYQEAKLDKQAETIREMLIAFFNNESFTPINRSMFKDLIAESYLKSARYHHSLATISRSKEEYDFAAFQYTQYIDYFSSKNDEILTINMYLADLFFEKGDFLNAGVEYSKVAWEYPAKKQPELKEKAALASVNSFINYFEKVPSPTTAALDLFYLAAEQFVSTYPDNSERVKVHFALGERLFIEKEYGKAIEVFQKIIDSKGEKNILIKSLQRLAQSFYNQTDYEQAIFHFRNLMNFIFTSSLPETADRSNILYKVGISFYTWESYERFSKGVKEWRDGKWLDELKENLWAEIANRGQSKNIYGKYSEKFERLIAPFTDEEKNILSFAYDMEALSILNRIDQLIQQNDYSEAIKLLLDSTVTTKDLPAASHYLYRAAMLYMKNEGLEKAYDILSFIEKNESLTSDTEYKYPVLMQLAYVSDKLKKQQEMVKSLKKVTFLKDIEESKRLDAIAKTGFAYESIGNSKEAVEMFSEYLRLAPPSTKGYVEISFRTGKMLEDLAKIDEARKYYEVAINASGENSNELYYKANAHFNLMEHEFKKYKAINLTGNIAKKIELKKNQLNFLTGEYKKILKYGVFEFTTASFHRIGMINEEYARVFKDSPLPANLNEDEKTRYLALLQNKIEPILIGARGAYEQNIKLLRTKKFNKWIMSSLKAYTKLTDTLTFKNESIVGMGEVMPLLYKLDQSAHLSALKVSDFILPEGNTLSYSSRSFNKPVPVN